MAEFGYPAARVEDARAGADPAPTRRGGRRPPVWPVAARRMALREKFRRLSHGMWSYMRPGNAAKASRRGRRGGDEPPSAKAPARAPSAERHDACEDQAKEAKAIDAPDLGLVERYYESSSDTTATTRRFPSLAEETAREDVPVRTSGMSFDADRDSSDAADVPPPPPLPFGRFSLSDSEEDALSDKRLSRHGADARRNGTLLTPSKQRSWRARADRPRSPRVRRVLDAELGSPGGASEPDRGSSPSVSDATEERDRAGAVLFEHLRLFAAQRRSLTAAWAGALAAEGHAPASPDERDVHEASCALFRGKTFYYNTCKLPSGGFDASLRQQNANGYPVNTLAELLDAARGARAPFQQLLEAVCDRVDGLIFDPLWIAPQKSAVRAREKALDYAAREPGPPEAWLYDVVRGMLVCDSGAMVLEVLEALSATKSVDFVKAKNRFAFPTVTGWRDVLISLRLPVDGGYAHVCELQIVHGALLACDAREGCHFTYEWAREMLRAPDDDALRRQMRALDAFYELFCDAAASPGPPPARARAFFPPEGAGGGAEAPSPALGASSAPLSGAFGPPSAPSTPLSGASTPLGAPFTPPSAPSTPPSAPFTPPSAPFTPPSAASAPKGLSPLQIPSSPPLSASSAPRMRPLGASPPPSPGASSFADLVAVLRDPSRSMELDKLVAMQAFLEAEQPEAALAIGLRALAQTRGAFEASGESSDLAVHAELANGVGLLQLRLGRPQDALAHLSEAHAQMERAMGKAHAYTVRLLKDVVEAKIRAGALPEALEGAKELLRLEKLAHGFRSAPVAAALCRIAAVQRSLRRVAAATISYTRALDILRERFGDVDDAVADCRYRLGACQALGGQAAKALETLGLCAAAQRQMRGEAEPRVLVAIGDLHFAQNAFEDALDALEPAFELYQERRSLYDSATAQTLYRIALAHFNLGAADEAKRILERLAEVYAVVFGERSAEHRDVLDKLDFLRARAPAKEAPSP